MPLPVSAQASSPGDLDLILNARHSTLDGSDFLGVDPGPGLEVGIHRGMAGGWILGVGGGVAVHSLKGLPDDLRLVTLFLEPRRPLPVGPERVRPHLGARLGYARWAADVTTSRAGAEFHAGGLEVGAVAGLRVGVTERVAASLGGTAAFLSFRGADGDVTGEPGVVSGRLAGSGTTGAHLGLRLGLEVSLR